MKKLVIVGLSVALTSVIFYSCSLLKALDEVEKNGFICSNYSPYPVNEMDKTEVLSMIRNYYQNQYRAINASTSAGKLVYFPSSPSLSTNLDSRAVFFCLDTLKRLIYNIEKASQKFSAQDKQNLGVNIFFASYPEQAKMKNWGHDYTNRHTLIFLPAIFDNVNQIPRDFDLNNSLNGINTLSPLYIDSAFLTNPAITSINALAKVMGPVGSPNAMNSQNHGTAIPPPPTATGNPILDITDPY